MKFTTPVTGLVLLVAAALVGCSSTSSSTSSGTPGTSSGTGSAASGPALAIADVAPFSGPDAALGPTYLASCYGATAAINSAGGVLGHQLTCKSVDTRGDPADAVPAVNQMFASTPNLVLVIGCTSDEAASVVPIINARKMAMFCMTGQSEFDSVHYPYFYRLVPPDLEESYAMVAIAQELHYKRIALAFGNDIGSQTFIQPAIAALKKAGMVLTTNQTLDLKATTFRTEAEAIIQSHPDAIMTEALGAADPTLFQEIMQLNGGKMIPVIGTSAAISPSFFKSAAAAVGASTFAANFHADNLVVESSGPAYQAFAKALLAEQGKVPGVTGNFTTYLSAPGGVHLYDGINLAALAMIMSHSTDPSVYGPDIIKIGNGVPGATVCYSFAACDAILKAGHAIRYEGPGGPTDFDSFHDSTGIFQVDTYSPNGQVNVVGNLSAAQLRALSG
ncbi:MAG TPA: ABC transporter substrate-binding protein [Trebonia sp.]|jgi:ABC-type branched-subunit amino acid transport system substrate-binding protein|nr:ABC transporter substrate-binding protein [Trebonia sp.]